MTLEIVDSGAASGTENMRRDIELCERVRAGEISPTLRLYTWTPWCISLGKHQNTSSIDMSAVDAAGFDVVHRPTGGRAVLHADEVTYCVCVPVRDALDARRIYAEVHQILFRALTSLVPDLSYATVDHDLRQHYAASGPLGQVCFTSHARTEILWHGKKIVGSAQRVLEGVVLQHGSILCGNGHERLAECITAETADRRRLLDSITASSATLTDAAGHSITQHDVITAIMRQNRQ
ncbi:MAG: lipoate--protein ligase family protein [Candidatus Kapabacteria bacterium]|nr:lipoate--protein ligase family protein [Candidatus Kapabacteria bacterium]